jgi:hypothetical protein
MVFLLKKNWQYEKDLDVNVLALRESGALDTLKSEWFQASLCSTQTDLSTPMSIESMAGLFLTFGVICALSVLLFIWFRRFIIKDFVLTLIHGKKLTTTQNVSSAKDSFENPPEQPSRSATDAHITTF